MTGSLQARLWEKVAGPWVAGVTVDSCWLFTAKSRSTFGYGRVREGAAGSRLLLAHRVVATQFGAELDSKTVIRHLCDVPLCCNPFHLRPGTQKENVADQLRYRLRRRFKARRDR